MTAAEKQLAKPLANHVSLTHAPIPPALLLTQPVHPYILLIPSAPLPPVVRRTLPCA